MTRTQALERDSARPARGPNHESHGVLRQLFGGLGPSDKVGIERVSNYMIQSVSERPRVADLPGFEWAAEESGCLRVDLLGVTIRGHRLLSDVSFTARPGSLTAVIGPSGAGKSTLAKLIAGVIRPTAGTVMFDGHDVHSEYAALRRRIGLVPQADVVHHQLTVEQALGYAAELRLPRAGTVNRRRAVQNVLAELELTHRRGTRVDRLSGGERKRASVAMELLTSPSLLILDEPTSGLDPALDRQVMLMLRRLADAGRVVIVVTHCLTHLDVCDQLLFLGPRGKTAYCGPPDRIAATMGTTNWADLFTHVGADPEAAHRRFLARGGADTLSRTSPRAAVSRPPRPKCHAVKQVWTIARRQVRLVVADRGYFLFLAALPFILGTLALLVPGNAGLGAVDLHGNAPNEPVQILMLLNTSAVFMGTALTIRDLIGERGIYRREQAIGLSASAYLCSKIVVYSLAAALQTAVLTAIVVIGKGAPQRDAVVLGNPSVELYVALAATAAVAAIMGLVMSAAATSQDQVLPMLVMAVMLSIVFSGGLIPVTDRIVLDEISRALPARWGFAAAASTTDLRNIAPLTPADETLWCHTCHTWLFDVTMLAVLAVVMAAFIRWRIRLIATS
jgi:ABC-type multidrug transport system ATPase subunit